MTPPALPASLVDLLGRRAERDPETPYFHVYDETVTYGRLWRESARYAAGLRRFGVDRGDTVCLIYPTCAEFFYTFFGALRLGAIPVPLYPTLGVEATASIFRDSEASVVATIGWFRPGVDESRAAAANVRHIVEPTDLEVDDPVPAFPTMGRDDTAFLQYTSGSTGQPRGVVLSHANVVDTVAFMAEAAQLTRDDVVVSWLPLYHDMGLIGCSFTPPWSGAPLYLLPPDLTCPAGARRRVVPLGRASFSWSALAGLLEGVFHAVFIAVPRCPRSGGLTVGAAVAPAVARARTLRSLVSPTPSCLSCPLGSTAVSSEPGMTSTRPIGDARPPVLPA